MKKHQFLKRFSACVMVVIMTLTAVPLSGLVGLELPKWSELFSTKASAAKTYTEGLFRYTVSDGEATITECSFSISGELVIPDKLGGYPVTSIYWLSFAGRYGLTSVTIPDSVISIDDYAFGYCDSLTSITIPDSVTSIGNYAFYDCTSLTSVTIGKSVTSIGEWAFHDCTGLTSITVDENNPNYSSLNGVLFNKDQTELLQYPTGKAGAYTIPDRVTIIGDGAFDNCTGLTSITIPDSVTSIGYAAFYDCTDLTSITIPDGVTSIGRYAFSYCNSLKSVTIGNSVTNIGEYAFYECDNLTSVTIGNSVTNIGDEAFEGCTSLKSVNISDLASWCKINFNYYGIESNPLYYAKKLYINGNLATKITIPDSVTSIGDCTFFGCSSLTSVTIPNSVTSIGECAFSRCTGLTSVTIPNSVTSIGECAFSRCTGLTSITIPDSVTSIGEDAFDNTAWYEAQPDGDIYAGRVYYKYKGEMSDDTTVEIKDGTKEISDYAFYDCSGLTEITIPDSVTSIGDGAFEDCTGLTSITIPNSVTSIGRYVFEGCTGLTSVTIPNSVTSIGGGAFWGCTGLTSVTIPDSVTSIGSSAFEDCTGLTSVTIPNSVTSIGGNAFAGCTGLTKINWNAENVSCFSYNSNAFCNVGTAGSGIDVVFGDNVKSIPAYAFYVSGTSYSYRPNIKSVTIGNSVTSIGEDAFDNTVWYDAQADGEVYIGKVFYKYKGTISENTSVVIKGGTKSIAGSAFYDCTGLTSVTIPDSVTNIGSYAFSNCTGLTSVTIPDSVTSIGRQAFYNCAGLTSVTIPGGVTSIGKGAFNNCTGLTSVTIPDGVTSIGEGAFNNCTGLTSVTIPDGVTSIGDSAFWDCTGLTSVTIGNSVTSIGRQAFYNCAGLTSVTIPDSVTNIGSYAFSNCTGLTSITIPDSVTSIGECAFEDCTGLTSVTIPKSVTDIGKNAFGYYYFYYDVEYGKIVKIDGFTIYGYKDTEVEKYAKDNDFKFVNLDDTHTHSYSSKITKAATCTSKGVRTYTCSCGESYTKEIPAKGHTEVVDKAVAATCTKTGLTEGKRCSVCNKVIVAQKTVSKKDHTYKTTTTTKATTSKDGKSVTACTVCGKVSGTTTIYKASSVKLSKTSYTYNGKVQKPSVTVKNSKGKALKNGTDYTVSYASGCKNTGKYAVKITFKGNYSGSKTLYFNILPSKTSKLTVSQTTTSIKATWKAVTGASGYKVTLYNAKGKAVKTVYTTKTTISFTKLSKGTTYKVRVTAYKTIDGKKVASSVYTQLTTATKPGTPTLKVKAGTKKASLSWNKQTGASGYVVYMATSKNGTYKKIATVKGGTKVSYTKTGLTKGKTYYFKVKAYVAPDSKTTVYGDYSAVKSSKIK